MMFYTLAIIGICYLGYRLTLAMPCGEPEPLTDDEMEWIYGEKKHHEGYNGTN